MGAMEPATPEEIRGTKVEQDTSVRGPPLGGSESPSEPQSTKGKQGSFSAAHSRKPVWSVPYKEGFAFKARFLDMVP